MVSVDYATLYQIVRQSLYTGVFCAQIPASRSQQGGEVELYIQNGEVFACFFTSTHQQRYKWDNWEVLLSPLGTLNWETKAFPNSEPPSGPQTPPASSGYPLSSSPSRPYSSAIPYQEATLTQAQLAQLPISCRSVYFLVNGSRTIEDIAQTLSHSPQEIFQIIEYLSRLGSVRLR
ncbi:MAG TPA: hypothetical protein VFV38_07205 [Ktedonobacteraceae bacterium]|nr:hypothetical protein [Ktedonobacteraceae bacterium]